MRPVALMLAAAVCMPTAAAEVYKTTDAEGNVIFSDQPSPDAETIQIQETLTVPGDKAPPFEYTPDAAPAQPYTALSIVTPADDEAMWPEDQAVRVEVRAEPGNRGTDAFVLFLDGKEHSRGTGTTFLLNNLERGTHTVSVTARDSSGKELIKSNTVTFHVLRTSVLPAKGTPKPGTKPPPKPPKPSKAP